MGYQSTKIFDGFSTCFRQWKATTTHCSFLHGYAVSFKVTFAGELDERNWVFDFGGMKRAETKIDGMSPAQWMSYMFDHTTVIAADDPLLPYFEGLAKTGGLQLRILPRVGCEMFAEYMYTKLTEFLQTEMKGRVTIVKVECCEHGKNSAIYTPPAPAKKSFLQTIIETFRNKK